MPEVQSTHSARRKALVPGLVATGVGPTAGGWRKVATVRRAVASLAMEPKVQIDTRDEAPPSFSLLLLKLYASILTSLQETVDHLAEPETALQDLAVLHDQVH